MQKDNARWWAMGATAMSLFVVGLDMTVLNVALPDIAVDLHASTAQLQWFADAYLLVMAAVMLPAGMLGDRFGRKVLTLGALAVFGLGSLWCALADSPEAGSQPDSAESGRAEEDVDRAGASASRPA